MQHGNGGATSPRLGGWSKVCQKSSARVSWEDGLQDCWGAAVILARAVSEVC